MATKKPGASVRHEHYMVRHGMAWACMGLSDDERSWVWAAGYVDPPTAYVMADGESPTPERAAEAAIAAMARLAR